jgi:S-formylglutathione hydrolase FrmB
VLALALLAAGCARHPRATAVTRADAAVVGTGVLRTDTVVSAALAGNLLGDSPRRQVTVYLPPSYATEPARRYPVLYLLHGFDGTDAAWLRGPQYRQLNIAQAMDSLLAAGTVREMIVVMPDAKTRVGGSFYTDSPVTGGWDAFTARELVAAVDARYRTLARPESRGVAGHSMGGFGALVLAMRHGGDVFGAAYALSPCCTRVATTGSWGAAWDSLLAVRTDADAARLTFIARANLALAQALSPDPARTPLRARLLFAPAAGGRAVDEAVRAQWERGSPLGMVAASAGRLRALRGLRLDVGRQDALVPVAELTALDSALTANGVPHVLDTYPGTHGSGIRQRMTTQVLPFFSAVLLAGDH